jgi:hypothetical protein
MRTLLIDDALPAGLAEELAARGRPARGLEPGATDAEALAADAVLVTVVPLRGGTVAVIGGRSAAERRDIVHRWAHVIAAQRPGSTRQYR